MSLLRGARRATEFAATVLGVNARLRASNRQCLLALAYHEVVPDECERDPLLHPNATGVSEFSRQMEVLARYYHPIGVAELRDWRNGRPGVPCNPALVTFDDGYRNNLTFAAPVLLRLGIPALINVAAGHIGRNAMLWPDEVVWRVLNWPEPDLPSPDGSRKSPAPAGFTERAQLAARVREECKRVSFEQLGVYLTTLRKHQLPEEQDDVHALLSWEEVKRLKALGFDIGSHTMRHPILTQLPASEVERELQDSKRLIEEMLGSECECFAYPNGGPRDVSPAVVEQVRRAGYSFAFTVMDRLATPADDPLTLDRVYVPAAVTQTEFECRISGLHGMLKSWSAAPVKVPEAR
jgi:peptidoglycan/xylan/chitin deacetylase (PgdA/CDA1 family)